MSLIFHHLMFISVHTMLLYIDFLFALFTDNPVLSSYLESHDIFINYLHHVTHLVLFSKNFLFTPF